MQTFSPKASSVLEKKIFKGFYHKWAWKPSWSMNRDHFSNLLFLLPKEVLYDNSFSNFGRPPIPDDSCKGSAPRHSRFWNRRFLKVFTIYGHGGHLGQRTTTILAIFLSPTLRRLHMKFEQNWLSGFRGEVV